MDNNARTLVSLKEYVDVRLAALEKSAELSCAATDRRLANMNEFREALRDQAGQMATRKELEALEDKIELRLRPLQDYKTVADAKASQKSVDVALLIAVASLLLGVAQLMR